MDAQEQRLEVERSVARDDDLAIEHAAVRERCPEWFGQLGEVAVQRLEVAGLRVDAVSVTEHQGAEAIPLGLEQPAVVAGERVGRLGQHRLDGRVEGECHRATIPP